MTLEHAEPAVAVHGRRPYEAPAVADLPVNACISCGRAPAVIGTLFEPPRFCRECGTACGDECCGMHWDWRAEAIEAAWGLSHA